VPAEQANFEGPRVQLTALTEADLRGAGAVKLLYSENAELRATHTTLRSEFDTERRRTDSLTIRLYSSQTECCVLRERLGAIGYRDLVVRLIELVILGLLAFAIDFAKSGSVDSLTFSLVMSFILAVAIALIQRGHRPKATN
jgi:hypothetical protein